MKPVAREIANDLTCSWGRFFLSHWVYNTSWSDHSRRHRNHSGYGLSQWDKALLCIAFYHWLSTYPEWSLGIGQTLHDIEFIQTVHLVTMWATSTVAWKKYIKTQETNEEWHKGTAYQRLGYFPVRVTSPINGYIFLSCPWHATWRSFMRLCGLSHWITVPIRSFGWQHSQSSQFEQCLQSLHQFQRNW